MTSERLRSCGFSKEYFPQFHGTGQRHELALAIRPPHKNPDAAACVGGRKLRCHHSALGSSQRRRKTRK
jgi:hypothetical protein